MILWLAMNVGLPLLPVAFIAFLGWIMEWRRSILDVLADGQLYFLSVGICAVFLFDAGKGRKLESEVLVPSIFMMLTLMVCYTASMLLAHGIPDAPAKTGTPAARKLAVVSILLAVATISGVGYGRFVLLLTWQFQGPIGP